MPVRLREDAQAQVGCACRLPLCSRLLTLPACASCVPLLPPQAEYHAEKFRVFPHVDSPARLIRELVRPAALGGKAAAGGKAAGGPTAPADEGEKENAGMEA